MSTKAWMSAAAILLSAAVWGGCTAEVEPAPAAYPTEDVDVVPSEVESAPYVMYEGRPVHYYQGRWYFRNRNSWSYYRNEPPALYRQRPYVQQAPPAQQVR
jgi:hypothetical protein